MNSKNNWGGKPKTDKRNSGKRWPGRTYWIILFTTLVLLVAFTASFFVALAVGKEDDEKINLPGNDVQNAVKPLPYPTVTTLESYKAKTGENVAQVGSGIKSEYTILVKIGETDCTSIAEKNADAKIYPASMTKVMSMLVVCESLKSTNDLNKTLTIKKEFIDAAEKSGGSGYGLKEGEILTIKDLLYLTSYCSDTVAVLTLAEYVAGSEAGFVKLMNQKVSEIGLSNTNFTNCTGLHDENNYTTCREMAAIMTYALDNTLCNELLTSYKGYPLVTNKHPADGNYMLWSSWYSGPNRFADNPRCKTVTVKAAKTGYVDESGMCLVSYAESGGNKYVNVIVARSTADGVKVPEADSTKEVRYIYNTYAK